MQVGVGFFASKALLSAVKLGLFSELAKHTMTASEIAKALGLHHRAVPDFPDALVALGFLRRDGDGADGVYSNTPESAVFLDRNSPDYVSGILEMANARRKPIDMPQTSPRPIETIRLRAAWVSGGSISTQQAPFILGEAQRAGLAASQDQSRVVVD